MEHTKKLMLVDPASYCRQQKTEYTVPNPAINTLGSIDAEMKTILDGGYNEDEKIKLLQSFDLFACCQLERSGGCHA